MSPFRFDNVAELVGQIFTKLLMCEGKGMELSFFSFFALSFNGIVFEVDFVDDFGI